jgi:hypothetical protein
MLITGVWAVSFPRLRGIGGLTAEELLPSTAGQDVANV